MSNHQSYVYILASKKYGTLYVGITSDLITRIYQHKNKLTPGFTMQYNIDQLVYYEVHEDINEAIAREKKLKKWRREWKINLIEEGNPYWIDLFPGLVVVG